MAEWKEITKAQIDDVLSNYNVYRSSYDAQNKVNAASHPLPQWWGDEDRKLELDLETGIVWETQDDGSRVGMGAFDEDGLKALADYEEKQADLNRKRAEAQNNDLRERQTPTHGANDTSEDRTRNKNEDSNRTPSHDTSSDKYKREDEFANSTIKGNSEPKTDSAKDVIKKIGATAGTFGASTVEGIGKFGEKIVDAAAVAATAMNTSNAVLQDAAIAFGKAMFQEKSIFTAAKEQIDSGVTKNMWNNTKGFVANEYVSSWADKFWDETTAGQVLKNNSYGFETARTAGNVTGEIAGIALLTIATMGIGGAAAGGAEAAGVGTEVAVTGTEAAGVALSGAGAAGTTAGVAAGTGAVGSSAFTTANVFSALSGAAGFGSGTEEAWKNGASTARGLAAGSIRGAVDLALSKIGIGVINSNVSNGAKVAINTAVGAAGGFANPVSSAVANNSSYSEEFENAGGMKTVGVDAAVSGIGTAIAVGTAKTKVTQIEGETNTQNNVAGAIEEKPVNVKSNSNVANAIEDQSSGNIKRIEVNDNVGTNTSSTGSGTKTASNSSNTSSYKEASNVAGEAAKATNGNPTASSQVETDATKVNEFMNEVNGAINKRGGVYNLTAEQRVQLANTFGVPESKLFNMDIQTYRNLVKQFHTDNIGNQDIDTSAIISIISKLYKMNGGGTPRSAAAGF